MSYQNGIINYLQKNEITISFTDNEDTGVTPIAAITSDNIVSESLTLKQSICDNDALTFGGCIASELSIKLLNTNARQFTTELTGRWISVQITQFYADPEDVVYPSSALYPSGTTYPGTQVNSQSFYVFSGYIDSATIDKTDKNIINIKAYDVLAKLYEEDITNWLYMQWKYYEGGKPLNQILTQCLRYGNPTAPTTIPVNDGTDTYFYKVFYERVNFSYTGTRVCDYTQRNEDWANSQAQVNKGKLLKWICEALGVFGIIRPNDGRGLFDFVGLSGTPETYDFYEQLEASDYLSTGYTDFLFDVAGSNTHKTETGVYTDGGMLKGGIGDAYDYAVKKTYDFTDNILLWENVGTSGRTQTNTDTLINNTSIGTRLALNAESTAHAGQCAFSTYQPLTATLDGRLWVTVGTPIQIMANETTPDGDYPRDPDTGEYILDEHGQHPKYAIQTYVLSRTLTGIQALTDNITVKGVR